MPKQQIDAAGATRRRGSSDSTTCSSRKPKALSGGQRQRVAMGRAIVRHPQAFLMDEPLSNLDAKLRVQMRSEIARIQHDLGVTTIYVTHDQTEAMTMGDRVAVIRKGELQQVDNPQTLYEHPVNVFVAGFIGSPAMNLVDATLAGTGDGLVVEFGGFRLPVPSEVVATRPDLRKLRRTAWSCSASGPRTWRTRRSSPTRRPTAASARPSTARGAGFRRRRALHDRRRPPAMTDDVKELAVDVGTEALEHVQKQAARRPLDDARPAEPAHAGAQRAIRSSSSSTRTACTSSIPTTDPASTEASTADTTADGAPATETIMRRTVTQAETHMRLRTLIVPARRDGTRRSGAAATTTQRQQQWHDERRQWSKENTGKVNLLSAGEPEEVAAYQKIFDELINAEADYKVEVESVGDFEEQFQIRAEGGTLDVAAAPQPGSIPALVDAGAIVALEDLGFDIDELNDAARRVVHGARRVQRQALRPADEHQPEEHGLVPEGRLRRGRLQGARRRGTS